jgi:hypothetical protein
MDQKFLLSIRGIPGFLARSRIYFFYFMQLYKKAAQFPLSVLSAVTLPENDSIGSGRVESFDDEASAPGNTWPTDNDRLEFSERSQIHFGRDESPERSVKVFYICSGFPVSGNVFIKQFHTALSYGSRQKSHAVVDKITGFVYGRYDGKQLWKWGRGFIYPAFPEIITAASPYQQGDKYDHKQIDTFFHFLYTPFPF